MKKILLSGRDDLTRVTQIGWGTLLPTEKIPPHRHMDMDEFFFFIKGTGSMKVNGQDFILTEGVFISVPAIALHELECTGEPLEFFYFGLQIYKVH
ncbi:cupin domain-containing protein [Larkinella arboricola]|nr:cupin domain-containing protein [Larkinella arboricola]